jgi:hypothetical protein
MSKLQFICPGTLIYPPDDLHRVILQFEQADDAIVFFEFMRDVAAGRIALAMTRDDTEAPPRKDSGTSLFW